MSLSYDFIGQCAWQNNTRSSLAPGLEARPCRLQRQHPQIRCNAARGHSIIPGQSQRHRILLAATPAQSEPATAVSLTAADMTNNSNGTAGGSIKSLWVQTADKAAFTAAVEAGVQHFVFDITDGSELAAKWDKIAAIPEALWLEENGAAEDEYAQEWGEDGQGTADQIWHGLDPGAMTGLGLAAVVRRVSSKADIEAVAALASNTSIPAVVMNATDWQSIPAENLVAAFQDSAVKLMATAVSADDARVKLEALERGVDGVLLRTDDPVQVKELAAYLQQMAQQSVQRLQYDVATVTRLQPAGMGDRVCVDLCSNMVPGEGMLVGSFARGLFLVHSECAESAYINSRPFRVNAGPVHAYTRGEQDGSRTAYLAELCSGKVVQVADAEGRTRSATVGRVKVERRPLMLVEATADDGEVWSTMLQNAETVRLVGPGAAGVSAADDGGQGWQATSVSQLTVGSSRVYVLRQGAARHTGVAIEEQISER